MKLTDNLKKQADNAADLEKKTIKKADMKLSDDKLDTVSGGYIAWGNNTQCEYNPWKRGTVFFVSPGSFFAKKTAFPKGKAACVTKQSHRNSRRRNPLFYLLSDCFLCENAGCNRPNPLK